jgi:L-alanine-DL-glutamate epimerase-like enolase superfamily enzyme
MQITVHSIHLTKRVPLTISRGTSTGSTNVFVSIEHEGVTGIGECAPGVGGDDDLAPIAERQIAALNQLLTPERLDPLTVGRIMREHGFESPAMAAVDIALWDRIGTCGRLPLHRLLGLPKPTVATSVTVGIDAPEIVREKTGDVLARTGGRNLKLKLGSPHGIDHDQASYEAARAAARPFGVGLRIDANGGWSTADAIHMIAWLSGRDCDYVEQPLPVGAESELPAVFAARRLPVYLDESIRVATDVVAHAGHCDGINLKLMKTGGITEALRVIHTARTHGLKTMIGCMGESSVSIAAGAALGALFDHIDLDSHLNLAADPAHGLGFEHGVVTPSDQPGLGVSWR